MKIKFSDMSGMIADEIIKVLAPAIRKIVREEVNKGVTKIIKEQKSRPLPTEIVSSMNESGDAKEIIARRARDRARSILEKRLSNDDPYASLIMEAEDPQEIADQKARQQLRTPMVKSSDIDRQNMAMPENIDFSDRLDKLGI